MHVYIFWNYVANGILFFSYCLLGTLACNRGLTCLFMRMTGSNAIFGSCFADQDGFYFADKWRNQLKYLKDIRKELYITTCSISLI
ncbi:hypothetical protein ES332_D12G018400v1 [Gossypium tomentosum]|uniref:Uncharacterized protein n=1 Tax=Gossypium tomentosum TaxID=34277 RepID=A0A5D2I462_GOSTO|nr:hypothetical protein ES332_D12G018400v1 [Gossypium tomentosum]